MLSVLPVHSLVSPNIEPSVRVLAVTSPARLSGVWLMCRPGASRATTSWSRTGARWSSRKT